MAIANGTLTPPKPTIEMPPILREIMVICTRIAAYERPSFQVIVEMLGKIPELTKFLE
jgi:hypothetical protein